VEVILANSVIGQIAAQRFGKAKLDISHGLVYSSDVGENSCPRLGYAISM
jgi:hypothetical protein